MAWFNKSGIEDSEREKIVASKKRSDIENKDSDLVDQAAQHIKNGEVDKAMSVLVDVVERVPEKYVNNFEREDELYIKFWDTSDFLSYVAWHQNNDRKEKVFWLKNAYPRAFYYLGYLQIEKGEYEKAISLLDIGLYLEPENPKLMIEKAQALIKLRRYEEALGLFDDVVSQNGYVNPSDKARALRSKGFIFIEKGDVNSAERFFLDSLQYEPDNDVAKHELRIINNIQSCIEESGRLEISEEEFNIWYPIELSTGFFMANRSQFNGDTGSLNLPNSESENEEKDFNGADFEKAIFKRMSQFVYYFRSCSDDRSRLGKSEEEFDNWYYSYYMSYYMVLNGMHKQSRWNDDIDQIAREVGALTEKEIEAAHTDLHQAILNRIKLRLVMDGFENEDDAAI
jgi:tetratricopeptide (TPR) repeat protein